MIGIRSRLWIQCLFANIGDLRLSIYMIWISLRYNFSKRNPYPRDDGQSKINLIQLKTWYDFIVFDSLINLMIACV